MRRLASFFAVVAVVAQSSAALGVVDIELLAGKGAALPADGGSLKSSASDVAAVSAHVAPLPMVPVAIGVEAAHRTYDATAADGTLKVSGNTVAPELMAWIPALSLSPYAKISATVMSRYRTDAGNSTTSEQSSNQLGNGMTQVGAGLRWSPFPVLSLLGEYRQNVRRSAQSTMLLGLAAGF